jgi:hypothetical protein
MEQEIDEPIVEVSDKNEIELEDPIPEEFQTFSTDLRTIIVNDVPRFTAEFDKLYEKVDHPSTPYKSKYTAKKLLTPLRERILELVSKESDIDLRNDGELAAARIGYLLGILQIDCEEISSGEKLLSSVAPILERRFLIILFIEFYNVIGLLKMLFIFSIHLISWE